MSDHENTEDATPDSRTDIADDPTLAAREWMIEPERPREIDLSDPKHHDEVMTFDHPRGLIRRGQIVAMKAKTTRFIMLTTTAILLIVTGVVMAIHGIWNATAFIVPTLAICYGLGTLVLAGSFVWFTNEERRFRRALETETTNRASTFDQTKVAGSTFGSGYRS